MLRNQVHTNGKGAKKNPLVKNNIVYFIKYHDVVDDDQITLSANFFTRELSVPCGTLVCVWETFRLRRLCRLRILFSV